MNGCDISSWNLCKRTRLVIRKSTYQKTILNIELGSSVEALETDNVEVLSNRTSSTNYADVTDNPSWEVEQLPGTTSIIAVVNDLFPATFLQGLRNLYIVGIGPARRRMLRHVILKTYKPNR